MVDKLGVTPSIFRPVVLRIRRVYRGAFDSDAITAFAESGTIGEDEISSCAFGSPSTLRIRETSSVVTVGSEYIALLIGNELTGRNQGPLEMPIIADLLEVHGDRVLGYAGTSEPLP